MDPISCRTSPADLKHHTYQHQCSLYYRPYLVRVFLGFSEVVGDTGSSQFRVRLGLESHKVFLLIMVGLGEEMGPVSEFLRTRG